MQVPRSAALDFLACVGMCVQEIDGLREAELAGKQIGTTKRGIGPAYASKATRNGVRVGDLRDLDTFAAKLRVLALDGQKRFQGFQYDVEVHWRAQSPSMPVALLTCVMTCSGSDAPVVLTGCMSCGRSTQLVSEQ